MNGPLTCGWGCGSRFFNADEQQAHEKSCPRRPASTGDRATGDADVASVLAAARARSRAA